MGIRPFRRLLAAGVAGGPVVPAGTCTTAAPDFVGLEARTGVPSVVAMAQRLRMDLDQGMQQI